MNDMYSLVREAQGNPAMLEELISIFEPKVKNLMKRVHPNDRQDLSQELRILFLKAAINYDIDSIPGIWEIKKRAE
ncbi:MAG TPA: hypothetical protein VNR61_17885 [Niallia sp.]|nr:hypothetical protein [Niallia sp.]